MPHTIALRVLLIATAWLLLTPPAFAQSYARFDVPDSALGDALRAGGFEETWNQLLVAWLRARVAGADSAARLGALVDRVAAGETRVLGTQIAADAVENYRARPAGELEIRLRAGTAEAAATAARGGGDFPTAEIRFRAALEDYGRVSDKRRAAWALGGLGGVVLLGGDATRAESLLTEALAARRAHGDERMVGNTLYDLGQAHFMVRDYAAARTRLDEARTVRERTQQTAQLGSTYQFMGVTMAALGRTDSAWVCFERGIILTSVAGDSIRTFDALRNYALMLASQGFVDRAVALYRRALVIAEERDDSRRTELHINIADVLRRAGRFSEALDEALSSVGESERSGRVPELVLALNNVGGLWLAAGDARPALAPLVRARKLADSLDHDGLRSAVLVNLSAAEQRRGNRVTAGRLATSAMAAAVAAEDSAMVRAAAEQLGDLAFERARPEETETYMRRALVNAPPFDLEVRASYLTQLALALQLQGRLDEAERGLHEAIGIAERIGALEVASTAWLNFGDVAERRGQYGTAIARSLRALDLIDSLRSRQRGEAQAIAVLASRRDPYETVIHLLTKLDPVFPDSGYAARAFDWAERARARALLDRAGRSPAAGARTVAIDAVAALLPSSRSALLHYSVGDSSSSLWVVTTRGWRHFRLPSRQALAVRIRTFRDGITEPGGGATEEFRGAQRRLYATLIAPAESLLSGVDELVISPDGPLAQLPFEALRDRTRAGTAGPYVVERFAVSYVPSASLLAALDRTPPAADIVALGNPDFGTRSLPASSVRGIGGVQVSAWQGSTAPPRLPMLPGTARELSSLRAAGGSRPAVLLSGRDATRSRLLGLPTLPNAAIVHLGTHGVANELEPERSGLWLAVEPGARSPSFLSVPDVSRLRLHASLVTLSACETGLGPIDRGEGVMGLARAFLAAGARSVVVSQWRVADKATADLMAGFYRGLLVEGRPRAEALARAKRALMRDPATASPHFWAPFVLIGRSGPLE